MHGPTLLLSAALLFLLASARGQEVCSNAMDVTTMYNGTANMNCGDGPTYRWWRSNDQCQSFVEHSNCGANRSCIPTVNDALERYYHFCCTDQSVTDASQVANSMPVCFRIQICTDISNEVAPPVVLLGATEKIYISLFGEPLPIDTPDLKLFNTTTRVLLTDLTGQLSPPQRDFFYLDSTSELTFIYTFTIPDDDDILAVSDIVLEFSTQFSAPVGTCSGRRDTTIDIPVRRTRTTPTPAPTSTAFPPAPTGTTPTAMSCRSVSNLAIGFIAFSVVVLVLLIVVVVILVVVCWKLQKSTSLSDPLRPPSLPISSHDQYHPLRQTSMTPGSVVQTPGTPFGQQQPLLTARVETAFAAAMTPATLTTTAPPPHYETIGNRLQDSTSDTDAEMSESQSVALRNPNTADDTNSNQVATNSETDTLDAELPPSRNPDPLYDEYDGELQNPSPTRNV